MYTIAFVFHIVALSFYAEACPPCNPCIALEYLLSEAYGIEITIDGLSSAVAVHNGTMRHISSATGSSEYQDIMQTTVDKYIGQGPQRRGVYCYMNNYQRPEPSSSTFAQVFRRYTNSFWWGRSEQLAEKGPPEPIHPNVRLFQAEMEALVPFANMSREQRSKVPVAITNPGWLTETEELCQFREAAARTFPRSFFQSHPSASYTAMGYELCPIHFDYFYCTGPGRLMTVDFQKNDLVALTLARTPQATHGLAVFTTVSEGLNHTDLVTWINSFVDSEGPDMVMITGPYANVPYSQEGLDHSEAAALVINESSIPADGAAVMGAAQAAKTRLERIYTGCWESEECFDIRREADRIAGKFRPPTSPSTWSANEFRVPHEEL